MWGCGWEQRPHVGSPDVVDWPTSGHERVPDIVDLIPVDARDSTCMRRGKSLSAGQFTCVARIGYW